jgi:hypothetical protein
MPPPSPLVIATGAVTRLLKEEASYHKELQEQEAKVKAQEEKIQSGQDDEEGNATYILKQHVCFFPFSWFLPPSAFTLLSRPLRKLCGLLPRVSV